MNELPEAVYQSHEGGRGRSAASIKTEGKGERQLVFLCGLRRVGLCGLLPELEKCKVTILNVDIIHAGIFAFY